MTSFFITTWLSGVRGRSFHVVFFLALALVAIAYLAGSFSPRHPTTVVLDVGFSGARFSMLMLVLFWSQELVSNEFDRKTVFFALTYPVPRWHYLAGRFFGIISLSATAVCLLALMLWIAVFAQNMTYQQEFPPQLGWPYWIAMGGVWLDSVVVTAMVFCLSTLSTTRAFPFVMGFLFAIGARTIGPVMEYVASGADGDMKLAERYGALLNGASWVIPDLSRVDWRVWPMYGVEPPTEHMLFSVLILLCYSFAMFMAAVLGLGRRSVA